MCRTIPLFTFITHKNKKKCFVLFERRRGLADITPQIYSHVKFLLEFNHIGNHPG